MGMTFLLISVLLGKLRVFLVELLLLIALLLGVMLSATGSFLGYMFQVQLVWIFSVKP